MNIKNILLVSILSLFLACSDGNIRETASGMQVTVLTKGDGDSLSVGDEIEMNLAYTSEKGSTLFNSDERGGPVKFRITPNDAGLFGELFKVLNVGDSIYCEIPAENLYEETFGRPLPDSLARGSKLKFNVGIVSAFDMTERIEKQKAVDAEIIEKYLADNSIRAQTDESGLKYVITKEGSGDIPNSGDSVVVHYTGKFLANGRKFDSSLDRGTPFEFVIGKGVIEGWSTGFGLLKEGAEATFYIPSHMAYGEGGYPGAIPPNAILVFDVEFLEIKK